MFIVDNSEKFSCCTELTKLFSDTGTELIIDGRELTSDCSNCSAFNCCVRLGKTRL